MRLGMITLVPLVLLAGLAGCSDPKKTMSKYEYALDKIEKRWVAVRKNFAEEDPPNIFLGTVLKKDFQDLVIAMDRTYDGSNRDEVMSKLRALSKKFGEDIDSMVDTRFGETKLMPGAKNEDVVEAVEKAYAEYQELVKLVR